MEKNIFIRYRSFIEHWDCIVYWLYINLKFQISVHYYIEFTLIWIFQMSLHYYIDLNVSNFITLLNLTSKIIFTSMFLYSWNQYIESDLSKLIDNAKEASWHPDTAPCNWKCICESKSEIFFFCIFSHFLLF